MGSHLILHPHLSRGPGAEWVLRQDSPSPAQPGCPPSRGKRPPGKVTVVVGEMSESLPSLLSLLPHVLHFAVYRASFPSMASVVSPNSPEN